MINRIIKVFPCFSLNAYLREPLVTSICIAHVGPFTCMNPHVFYQRRVISEKFTTRITKFIHKYFFLFFLTICELLPFSSP